MTYGKSRGLWRLTADSRLESAILLLASAVTTVASIVQYLQHTKGDLYHGQLSRMLFLSLRKEPAAAQLHVGRIPMHIYQAATKLSELTSLLS